MSMYQRRLASSTHAIRRSLENRARRLAENLEAAEDIARNPPSIPSELEMEEMEDAEREKLEKILDAITLAGNPEQVRVEIRELKRLGEEAKAVERSGEEAKLSHLRRILQDEGFFANRDQRLLIFTEYKDTLNYLVERLRGWGFSVGFIHGGMRPGGRDEPGTRLHAEQQFREGAIQVLVATEAAGEGINLQCCHILFNYDIPWNPNRLEQRMGRIHRYGQTRDCLIFNFVAINTVEGKVLDRLHTKLQSIRDALDDDAVFNVVGEVLPAQRVETVLRDYYAGKLGDGMLVERRARAQERRIVPETTARFLKDAAAQADFALKPLRRLPHTFHPGKTPRVVMDYERGPDWRLARVSPRYPRLSTDRETAADHNLEWVTPGHPLFEALRRHALGAAREAFASGACFHSLEHEAPARLDFYRAQAVDGLDRVVQERLFAVELDCNGKPTLREPDMLGDLAPSPVPGDLPAVAAMGEPIDWLSEHVLVPFVEEVREERSADVKRIRAHVELALTEVLQRTDNDIGRAHEDAGKGVAGAKGRLAQAEARHAEVTARRDRRRGELERQAAITLQGVERLASVLILPHPERGASEVVRHQPLPETEMTAMRVVIEHEENRGCVVTDVHKKNVGYDITSLDQETGELRLIEIKGLARGGGGTVLLTPNERRVAEDRRDCYWLYVVTNCAEEPVLQKPIRDPARFPWHEVRKVQHYYLTVDALKKPMSVREGGARSKQDD